MTYEDCVITICPLCDEFNYVPRSELADYDLCRCTKCREDFDIEENLDAE